MERGKAGPTHRGFLGGGEFWPPRETPHPWAGRKGEKPHHPGPTLKPRFPKITKQKKKPPQKKGGLKKGGFKKKKKRFEEIGKKGKIFPKKPRGNFKK